MEWIVKVDKTQCNGCRECADTCPGDVFDMIDSCSHPVRTDECHGCHCCEDVCEQSAVTVKEGS